MSDSVQTPPAAPARDRWHIVKDVPLALIATIALQTITVVWWASDINTRVAKLEPAITGAADDHDRLVRVEERLLSTNELLQSIDKRLERMEERRR